VLAPALMDICGNYDLSDFINVYTTYPLCGWTRSELAMRVTRPVRSRVVRGRPDAGVAWALYKLRMARGGATQLQGDLLREDASQLGGIGWCRSG